MTVTAEASPHEIARHYRPMPVAVSTATSYEPEQFTTTDPDLSQFPTPDPTIAALLWTPAFHQRPLNLGWELAVRNLSQDFADLVSRDLVSQLLPVHSPEDEPRLARHWASLLADLTLPVPSVTQSDALLDWDAGIAKPLQRRRTTVHASVRYRGRPKPKPIDDPWD